MLRKSVMIASQIFYIHFAAACRYRNVVKPMQDRILKEAFRALSNQPAEEIRKLFTWMLTTGKNLSLYPENHSICKDSINQLHEKLVHYIHKNGDITIEIERERVRCQNVEVSTGIPEEGTLPHILFRDGIGWLQITEGIELEEIRQMFSIIHKYSVAATEPQGDIVTDFWEARFEHVQYKADDFFSEKVLDPTESFSQSDVTPPSSGQEMAAVTLDKPYLSGGSDIDPSAFDVNPREEVILQEMVVREETASAVEHLNMLLDMLFQYEEKEDFNIILEVLTEEFKGSFGRYDFESALIILDGTRKVLDGGRLESPWTGECLESFYLDICSDAECLKQLEDIWGTLDARQIETLRKIFLHLRPPVIGVLAHLLLIQQPEHYGQLVEDTMVSLVVRNAECLDPLIDESDEKIVAKLFPIISRLDHDDALKHLMKLTGYPSISIRRRAIRAVLDVDSDKLTKMFDLIDDKDPSISRMILSQMGKTRREASEKFLLHYLQNKKFSDTQHDLITECFRTLGKCGSLKSIPFLSKTLMNIDLLSGSKTSLYREGAAIALAALDIPEAQEVIEKAGKSLRPGLRKIARDAGKDVLNRTKGG